jgi:hypothetical protein
MPGNGPYPCPKGQLAGWLWDSAPRRDDGAERSKDCPKHSRNAVTTEKCLVTSVTWIVGRIPQVRARSADEECEPQLAPEAECSVRFPRHRSVVQFQL